MRAPCHCEDPPTEYLSIQVAAARVRVEPLGADRRDRRYWWFRSEPRTVFVEDADSGAAAVVCDAAALEATLPRLNRKGVREVLFQKAVQHCMSLSMGNSKPTVSRQNLLHMCLRRPNGLDAHVACT